MTNLRELSEVFGVDMAYFIGESKVDEEEKEKDEAIEEKKAREKFSERDSGTSSSMPAFVVWEYSFLSLLLPLCRKLSGQGPKRYALSCPYNLHDCSPNSLSPSLQRYRRQTR